MIAEEAEHLSDRIVGVAHQIAVRIREGDRVAVKLVDSLAEIRGALARAREIGRRLARQEQVTSGFDYSFPRDEASLLPRLLGELAADANSLHDCLANTFSRFDITPAREAQTVAARLGGEIDKLAATSQALGTKIDESQATARRIEADLAEAEEMGRELEKALAGGMSEEDITERG